MPVLKLNVPTPGMVLSNAQPTLIDSELLFGCNASAETVNCVILFFIGFNATPKSIFQNIRSAEPGFFYSVRISDGKFLKLKKSPYTEYRNERYSVDSKI